MNKYPLIGVSIIVVVLIVLGSLNNIVGYQTVQASNQKIINSEIDQKELLFQTILDMVNNKEIQKVILGSELTGKRFFNPNMRFSTFTFPVITERFLKRMYAMGVILFRTLSKSKMQSLIGRHQLINQDIQKELTVVVQKDSTLKGELTQLSNLKCDCENQNSSSWNFPVICTIVFIIAYILTIIFLFVPFIWMLILAVAQLIDQKLNCWYDIPYP